MGRKVYHVTPAGEGDWKVKRERTDRADSIHENKQDAIDRARELATSGRLGQVVIHNQDGKIQSERTYRKDPYPPEG
jgi:hypothetical protein